MVETYLNQKILFDHVLYHSYDEFRTKCYIFSSIKEKKYFTIKEKIINQPNVSVDDQEKQLEENEEAFKADFKSFESDRRKASDKWQSEEQQIFGVFSGCIEENIWQDAKCLKSAYAIWNKLKVLTGQQTASTWMSSLNTFYSAKWLNNDSLSSFCGRVIKSHNDIKLIGDAAITFTPLQVVGKIISAIPNIPRYQALLQSFHNVEKEKLTIEFIQSTFIEEDTRWDLTPKPNIRQEVNKVSERRPNQPKVQPKQVDDKKEETKGRKCVGKNGHCKTIIAADKLPHINKCPDCHRKERKPRENQEKVSNVFVCSTSNNTNETNIDALYLDSGTISHVTNGSTFMKDLRPDKSKLCGPSGEIIPATKRGTIVFNVNDNQIEFRNSIVAPKLDRNLISVRKITAVADDIFVIFNKEGFEVFKGEVNKVGNTRIQGHIDSSGLYALSSTLDSSATSTTAEAGIPVVAKVEVSRKEKNMILWNSRKRNQVIVVPSNVLSSGLVMPPLLVPGLVEPPSVGPGLVKPPLVGPGIGNSLNNMEPPLFGNKPLLSSSSSNGPGIDSPSLQLRSALLSICKPVGTREPMPNFSEVINSLKKLPSRTLDEWHLSLAHISKKKILLLAEMGLIQISNPKDKFECRDCDSAKMKRKNFAKSIPPKAENVGEVVYSDVCGQISPPTLFGEKYIVTFIDELSGYIAVYLLKHKYEVFSRFKEVQAKWNNQNATTSIKMLISDGGGEYIGATFQEFLKKKGITHAKTPPNTPQRNGKSERLNKILFDLARAMLKARKMPRRFWGEAILHAGYVINRTPKNDNKHVRLEMIFGIKPTFEKMLEFGTPVMFHNHDPHIKKLDERSFEGIFLGFWEDDHTYKIFDTKNNMLVSTRTIQSYPNENMFFENNDWDEKFKVEDDDFWFSGLTDAPQYDYNQFQIKNNDNPFNNNLRNNPNPEMNNNKVAINNPPPINQKEDDDPEELEIPTPLQIRIPYFEQHLEDEDSDGEDHSAKLRDGPSSRYALRSRGSLEQVLSIVEIDSICSLAELDAPKTYKQALKSNQAEEWIKSIAAEHQSLIDHGTFEVVNRAPDKTTVTSGHVFKIKTDSNGAISKYKTRLVAKGYSQIYGKDYFEVFAPTLRMETIRYLVATAVRLDLNIYHLDVETAFLNGTLAEEIYMEIPEGFSQYDRSKQVFKLKKSIYGLKQASRVWNELFSSEIIKYGFVRSSAEPCLFFKFNDKKELVNLIGIFVDDCFVVGGDERVKNQLMKSFKMHDLGLLHFALGINFNQNKDGSIQMSQAVYVDKLLDKFQMQDCRTIDTPLPIKNNIEENSKLFEDVNLYQQIVGSLIYLSNSTRPDIAYAVSYLARSMNAPTEENFSNAKRVLRYLKGSRNLSLNFNNKNQDLFAYSDSSYAEENDRKSVGGYVTMIAGSPISWKSKKQSIIAQSSMEAEYIALAEAAKEVEWIRKLQREIFPKSTTTPTTIFEDNQSTINLSKNPIHSNRSKHIDVRYHKIQELVANKTIAVTYLSTHEMVADIMTKSLGRLLHDRFVAGMGLINIK
jgi:transposase InsO family protein